MEKDLITLQIQKEISNLFKSFLKILESLQKDNKIMTERAHDLCGSEIIDNINYMNDETYKKHRGQVLDLGNQASREILGFVDLFDYKLNEEKVKEALSQRKIVKRFTTSMPVVEKYE